MGEVDGDDDVGSGGVFEGLVDDDDFGEWAQDLLGKAEFFGGRFCVFGGLGEGGKSGDEGTNSCQDKSHEVCESSFDVLVIGHYDQNSGRCDRAHL